MLTSSAPQYFAIMCLYRGFVVSSLCCAVALSAPVASVGGAPVVDVSLAPEAPSELLGAIAGHDAAQGLVENAAAASDVRAFNAALQAAGPRIDAIAKQVAHSFAVAGRALATDSSSFLGRRGGGGAQIIKVDVDTGDAVDSLAVIDAVRDLEGKRAAEESREFSARLADFNVLTDLVVRGAGAAASSLMTGGRRAASFVEFQAAAGPSAAAVASMAARHAAGEELSRAKHLALAVALLRRENGMLRVALRREAAAFHSSAASFVSAGAAEAVTAEPGQYVFNLVPPEEDEHDTISAIDAVMVAERQKQAAANEVAASEKQRALDAEKVELRRVVR